MCRGFEVEGLLTTGRSFGKHQSCGTVFTKLRHHADFRKRDRVAYYAMLTQPYMYARRWRLMYKLGTMNIIQHRLDCVVVTN